MDVARMKHEREMVKAGMIVKRSEHEWLFVDWFEAQSKAQAMADTTDNTWYVIQVLTGKYREWLTISSNPARGAHIVSAERPQPSADDYIDAAEVAANHAVSERYDY